MGVTTGTANALESISQEHPSHKWLGRILEHAEGAWEITRRLVGYAGKREATEELIPVAKLINENNLRIAVPERINLVCTIEPYLDPIVGNFSELQEVILAVLNNAVEVISAGGSISIRTYRGNPSEGVSIEILMMEMVLPQKSCLLFLNRSLLRGSLRV